ncbi:chromate efflux transporter [Eionea flava]
MSEIDKEGGEFATGPVKAIPATPQLSQALTIWLHIGLLSFGGPAAQIALIHREIVEQRRWLSETQFLNALNFCMLLPGPEAMQLVTYVGWRLNGYLGGLLAGLLFVLPGAVVILTLATLYITMGDVPLVAMVFVGIKATVVVIVVQALWRVSKKALLSAHHWWFAGAAFISLFFLNIPYPFVILGAALMGGVIFRHAVLSPSSLDGSATHTPVSPPSLRPRFQQTATTIVIGLAVWWLPVMALDYWIGIPVLSEIAQFFSTLAVVTFGGAYSVLAYMTQDVVAVKGWLTAGEMMAGLGLAETTPGPLILVTEFVGFFAAYREGGWWLGVVGALVALWVTFVPCFLWIFTGGPYLDWLSGQARLRAALSAITAAVVGVMLSLSIWFALHVLFQEIQQNQWVLLSNQYVTLNLHLWQPVFSSINGGVALLMIINAYLLLKRCWSVFAVLLASSSLAVLISALF